MKITQKQLDTLAADFGRRLAFDDSRIMYLATLIIRIESGALKSDVGTDGLRDALKELTGA